jgi:hypothetical protein
MVVSNLLRAKFMTLLRSAIAALTTAFGILISSPAQNSRYFWQACGGFRAWIFDLYQWRIKSRQHISHIGDDGEQVGMARARETGRNQVVDHDPQRCPLPVPIKHNDGLGQLAQLLPG